MTDQTRADFEAHFQLTTRQAWTHPDGSYKFPEIQAKWEGYQAGVAKAAPQSIQQFLAIVDASPGPTVQFNKDAPAIRALQLAATATTAVQEPLPRFMVEKVQQAIKEATHPKGMSLHDGKARIDASILSRLLALAAAAPGADGNMEGAQEFIRAIIANQPIWPNNWGQDVAAAAYFIHHARTDAAQLAAAAPGADERKPCNHVWIRAEINDKFCTCLRCRATNDYR